MQVELTKEEIEVLINHHDRMRSLMQKEIDKRATEDEENERFSFIATRNLHLDRIAELCKLRTI